MLSFIIVISFLKVSFVAAGDTYGETYENANLL